MVEDHPDGPLSDLLGIRVRSCHGSILSNDGASGKPGAVQVVGSRMVGLVDLWGLGLRISWLQLACCGGRVRACCGFFGGWGAF